MTALRNNAHLDASRRLMTSGDGKSHMEGGGHRRSCERQSLCGPAATAARQAAGIIPARCWKRRPRAAGPLPAACPAKRPRALSSRVAGSACANPRPSAVQPVCRALQPTDGCAAAQCWAHVGRTTRWGVPKVRRPRLRVAAPGMVWRGPASQATLRWAAVLTGYRVACHCGSLVPDAPAR